MSLISVRNLFGPYRNKVQMGALIIAVILVLAIRMGSSRSSLKHAPAREVESGEREDLLGVLGKARKDAASARGSRSTDEVLDDLINEKADDGPSEQPQRQDKSESFEDIRKSLGLE